MEKNTGTEERIQQAARKVFMEKGLAGARMQEIADEAQINKAMLHYYYRNKEQLFKKIFSQVAREFVPKILSILGEDRPLDSKVKDFVGHYLNLIMQNPFMPLFLLSELRNQPGYFEKIVGVKRSGILDKLENQLKREAELGNIKPISAANFMANIMSLSIFPFLAQPLLQLIFSMSNDDFSTFIEERKQLIPELILSSLKV